RRSPHSESDPHGGHTWDPHTPTPRPCNPHTHLTSPDTPCVGGVGGARPPVSGPAGPQPPHPGQTHTPPHPHTPATRQTVTHRSSRRAAALGVISPRTTFS